ncbi:MAG: DUF6290 family protein [Gammaproteobacteria bacterium]|nr:DUF6290 family protein [Gammaproteobacteria bacterium]
MSVTLRLPPALEKRLADLSEKTHRSKSFYAREAIANYIEDLEDYYLALEISKNPGRIYSWEEVMKRCSLDD